MSICVVIVDDHELMREGLRAVLEREDDIEVVGEAASATDGLASVDAVEPDLVLIDMLLPDGDGLELCRRVRERHPGTDCVIITPYSSDDVLLSAIRVGASGFVPKRTTGPDLVDAVRQVAAGRPLIAMEFTDELLGTLRTRGESGSDPLLDRLSPQERRLLDHLADGLTNRQIADRMELAEKTVKNYVSNLLRKLEMTSRTEAAVFVTNIRAETARDDPAY
ncbi:MAG: response regulator [Acidimicrobiales bacterium]